MYDLCEIIVIIIIISLGKILLLCKHITHAHSGGHVSDLVVVRNCCMTRMLPGEAELVSE